MPGNSVLNDDIVIDDVNNEISLIYQKKPDIPITIKPNTPDKPTVDIIKPNDVVLKDNVDIDNTYSIDITPAKPNVSISPPTDNILDDNIDNLATIITPIKVKPKAPDKPTVKASKGEDKIIEQNIKIDDVRLDISEIEIEDNSPSIFESALTSITNTVEQVSNVISEKIDQFNSTNELSTYNPVELAKSFQMSNQEVGDKSTEELQQMAKETEKVVVKKKGFEKLEVFKNKATSNYYNIKNSTSANFTINLNDDNSFTFVVKKDGKYFNENNKEVKQVENVYGVAAPMLFGSFNNPKDDVRGQERMALALSPEGKMKLVNAKDSKYSDWKMVKAPTYDYGEIEVDKDGFVELTGHPDVQWTADGSFALTPNENFSVFGKKSAQKFKRTNNIQKAKNARSIKERVNINSPEMQTPMPGLGGYIIVATKDLKEQKIIAGALGYVMGEIDRMKKETGKEVIFSPLDAGSMSFTHFTDNNTFTNAQLNRQFIRSKRFSPGMMFIKN